MTLTNGQDTVTISTIEYARLNEAACKLEALEAAGVDNWEGYSIAMAENSKKD